MRQLIHFQFPADSNQAEIEHDICLALFASECIHGRPRTRLECGYFLGDELDGCVVEVMGPAGEAAVRVAIGLFNERFGEDGFQVERVHVDEGTR